MIKKNYRWIKNKLYDLTRKLFWSDYDLNEDFYCAHCGRPVFRRILFCSEKCDTLFNDFHNWSIWKDTDD